jgi:putative transcriptional regulator
MKGSVASKIIDSLQEFSETLKNNEVISKRFTCRRVILNLEPTPYDPAAVKRTRDLLKASQAVFAKFLGVSVKTVRAWEQGKNTPLDIACRFMDEIRRDPEYWRNRLRQAAVIKKPAASR